jgi:hypothetical protein
MGSNGLKRRSFLRLESGWKMAGKRLAVFSQEVNP